MLGPIEFIAYTEDVTELIAAYELSYHLLADDKQLYAAVRLSEVPAGCQRLVSCISDLQQWCAVLPVDLLCRVAVDLATSSNPHGL